MVIPVRLQSTGSVSIAIIALTNAIRSLGPSVVSTYMRSLLRLVITYHARVWAGVHWACGPLQPPTTQLTVPDITQMLPLGQEIHLYSK